MAEITRPPIRVGFDFSKWAIVPAIAITICFFVVPLIIMLLVSFWQRIGGKLEATWTLANYEKFFTKSYLVDALFNSIEVALVTTIVSVVLA